MSTEERSFRSEFSCRTRVGHRGSSCLDLSRDGSIRYRNHLNLRDLLQIPKGKWVEYQLILIPLEILYHVLNLIMDKIFNGEITAVLYKIL